MKNEESFLDFLIKNRYIIISLVIAFVIITSGILNILIQVAIAVIIIMLAIYVGSGLQKDKDFLKKMFKGKDEK